MELLRLLQPAAPQVVIPEIRSHRVTCQGIQAIVCKDDEGVQRTTETLQMFFFFYLSSFVLEPSHHDYTNEKERQLTLFICDSLRRY